MDKKKYTILVVEDDLDVAEMLNAYFRVQGYEVLTVNWGEDAVRSCRTNHPDLIILDIRLPDIDGYEVARRLRSNRRTEDIPIIFLTEKRARNDRLQGLELGADDYITKPFDVQELRLRVRNALRRAHQGSLNNPITNLPEGSLVEEELENCLKTHHWALILVALDNLDAFREMYGFVASDDVLRAVSLMITNTLREAGNAGDFVGHLNTTEFVVITSPAKAEALGENIRSRLEQSLEYFYPLKDRGTEIPPSQQLRVRMGYLHANQGPFADLDQLKTNLLRQRV
ncbi:MAG: response regulator [Anaerolineae bacterium]|nr:MAG: response regulator [Anaerolineae bacterium]